MMINYFALNTSALSKMGFGGSEWIWLPICFPIPRFLKSAESRKSKYLLRANLLFKIRKFFCKMSDLWPHFRSERWPWGRAGCRTLCPKNLNLETPLNVSPGGIGSYYPSRFTINKCPAINYYGCALFHLLALNNQVRVLGKRADVRSSSNYFYLRHSGTNSVLFYRYKSRKALWM